MNAPLLPRIMIVDDSRIVRATIIKRIRDRFDVREEGDGEDGWEALLIDPSIRLVITDHSMPRLDGYGLIERIRASKVARIRDLPVIMISGDEGEPARKRAKDLGATDFITKGTGAAELLARLDTLVELGRSHDALEEVQAGAAIDPVTGLPQRPFLLRQATQSLSYFHRHGGHVGILVVGMDHFDELVAAEGPQLGDALLARFAQVLTGAVRKEDSLARWGPYQFAVVTPGIDAAKTHQFAERLRSAVAEASIHYRGHGLRLTVTVGLAGSPEDGDLDAERLLSIAERRMTAAMAAGGNCVAGGVARTESGSLMGLDEALGFLAAGREVVVRPGVREFGVRLLPLLRLMALELQLDSAVAEIARRLEEQEVGDQIQSIED
jgi:two-component system, cell cycle response regulator